ncbi:MAG: Asp-tRNA(Asn)/Glu-tRNA(Gln) amidotransferase subunit GatB [Gemmatimonadetes bacterium]|uniref:Aspartyl/glutamyl-tRNA(Asn/Gln) amidotransferase subunit B n=1 Tax=Candidatus Kutchimonas denitrificans TaxID=3056748 RepID=A0AAE4ZCT9_9BACT|nr:Asp-tRNA(Asn)/Glu-tRNA(Gln) amidotransferase subunit GatB [Gemmatimonadota bacterium]NIR76226.1 Asp-tRNA(Asn)/Glu-tRNA(Gln) amidotransferase subunit GatB [Candidatus Kutchimonas denitrificans]NIS00666.1 Asp-tRNA(Asn)/Glu-tRNA(Gln) amidotransferase subunit GatB [Gemmatimonadota bacterium]NIT66811.1 Asp-tRNA(Asn)/Glu-tRNA(Gln) amidotransferase subunit GatB [Gemmatimonadota bacterium]NIV23410.1 Asp-tRNA(Asn)/Glu-tRNA(Gln) amidotransferase subunit GatB [Gemmatimonadota bacterium]
MPHETVIGLEIHVQLKTASKMFCGCRVAFAAPPNTLVCPVCLGLPGALPVVNERAVELAVRAAVALGCTVHPRSAFARKNYFYPDLPKGYQITQYDRPLATDGSLDAPAEGGGAPPVRIRRLHVEEDSGKSLHDRFPETTAIDLNRAGVPLVEIVTEPDLHSPAHARAFLVRLKQTLEYLEVSDCNMEEGSLRVDANVSVRRPGSHELATKTEVKNMNSFSQLSKALAFEASRQVDLLEGGGAVEHETMLWDPVRGATRPMRGKEEAHDYRYFPEPDLPTLVLPEALIDTVTDGLPELPWEKIRRFVQTYGLREYDAGVLSADRRLAAFFEATAEATPDPKTAANWVMGEMLAISNELGQHVAELGIEPVELGRLIDRVETGALSHTLGKQVLRRMIETGKPADAVIDEEGLSLVSDSDQIDEWVGEAIRENPAEVERYRDGEEKLLAFFIGQVMRKSRGKADPERVRDRLARALATD